MCCKDILEAMSIPKGCGIIDKAKPNNAKCPLLCLNDIFKTPLPLFYGVKDQTQGIDYDLQTTHPNTLSLLFVPTL